MRYDVILFDLDGTLLDTNELILASFLHTLERYYPGRYRREDILPHMGRTLKEQMTIFGPDRVEELMETYRAFNLSHHDEMVDVFAYVPEVLEQLTAHGLTLGIVTSKRRETTLRGLKLFQLDRYFQTIVAYEDTEAHKPNPEPVLLAMERLGCDPERTLMVGDSPFDLEAAHRAGIHAAAVKWSLRPLEVLEAEEPEYLLEDMRDLYAIAGIVPACGRGDR